MSILQIELDDVLQLLRVYRHDLLNQLQLVDGYAGMGQHDVSREKLQVLINQLKNERILQTIQAPQFVFWLINLKLNERDFNINWEVENNHQSIEEFDHLLVHDGKLLTHYLKQQFNDFTQVHMFIQINFDNNGILSIKLRILIYR